MIIYVFILLISYVACLDLPPTWLNPSDLHHSRKIEELAPVKEPSKQEELVTASLNEKPETNNASTNCICPVQPLSACDSYLKRMINLLLFESHMKNYRLPKEDVRFVPLTLQFTSNNLEILHEFASAEGKGTFSWTDLDEALSSLFQAPIVSEKTSENVIPPVDRDYTYFIFITITGSLLLIGLWLLLTSGSIFKSICGVGLLNFSVALVWNLIRAYNVEKQKIMRFQNKLLISNKSTSWAEYLLNPFYRLFGSSDDVPMIPENDPIFNLDYGKIVIETLCSVLNVLPILGEKVGAMIAEYYGQQSFFVRYIVAPIQFLINPVILLTFFLLLAVVWKGFFIKLPMFSIGIGNSEKPATNLQTNIQQQTPLQVTNSTGQAYIQGVDTMARQISSVAGPSSHTLSPSTNTILRRVVTEFHIRDPRTKDKPQRLPSITCTRKGPWHGSIVRYGFSKKRIVDSD